ncbi:hypothetical protein ZIOFF_022889 [Zingiber officinale]|uniref:Endoglucanase n=1 Tax=Zingiber officinale TaxID=94328 RepID=A0A8J5HM67_ZINOF|nr:hypothetical protein ZIOFF_022889 [Zingiber officinale]
MWWIGVADSFILRSKREISISMAMIKVVLVLMLCLAGQAFSQIDYGNALTKSLLFFEAQRSGKLPANQRVTWRGDSAIGDGSEAGVDLAGGYYDAGDNVKFGFPYAFAVTSLAWSVVEFGSQLQAKNELNNALAAVKWGTDYLLKAHAGPQLLYVEVGDGNSDHACWQRPEDMTTPRTVYKIDEANHGSDVAAETAAALAAASIAFKSSNAGYSATLLSHSKQLFDFATNNRGLYQNSVPVAGAFYSSSGDDVINQLHAYLIMEGVVPNEGSWAAYKSNADAFMCNLVQKGNGNVKKSPGGLLWFNQWANSQYVTSSSLGLVSHADHITAAKGAWLQCPGGTVSPQQLIDFARSQMDYLLGANPSQMSYMVGFGSNFPRKVHHRGASIVSIKANRNPIDCKGGFDWLNSGSNDPNVLEGAIVGGPDANDAYSDSRNNFQQAEPSIGGNAPLVGVLARIAA